MSYPILKPNSTWFAPNVNTITRSTITTINIVDTYTPADATVVVDSWDASLAQDGSILCYVEGTVLTIAGNGSGKIAANEDSGFMFYDSNKKDSFSALTELNGLTLIDTTNVTTLQWAFANCKKLLSLNLSAWNTSKCNSIYAIFYNCASVTSIDLTGWDISNMTNIAYTFDHCSSLTSVDVSNWNTSNVTDMRSVFNHCYKLATIDVSKWDTSKVTTILQLFQRCDSITSLDVSKWDTSNITNMGYAFWGCKGLTSLAVENWNVSNIESFDHTFAHCNNLVVDVTNWRPSSKCKYYTCLFHTNANEYLDVSGFDTSGAISMAMMFEANVNLKKIKGLENFDTSNVVSFQEMFFNCHSLEELDLSNFDTRKADTVTPIRSDGNSPSECTLRMLSGCRSLKKITLGENFTFAGDGTAASDKMGTLPTQNSTYVDSADGNWYTLDGTAYAVNDIPNLTAATYYASSKLAKYERNKNKLIDLNGLDAYHSENVKYIDEAINKASDEKFYVVTFDQGDDNEYHSDLTFAQIHEKFEAGGNMVARIDGTDYIPLLSVASTKIIFSGIYKDNSVSLSVDSNEVCTLITTKLANDSHSHPLATAVINGFMNKDDKAKLDDIESGAEVNIIDSVSINGEKVTVIDKTVDIQIPEQIQSDWNESNVSSMAYVKNRPFYEETGVTSIVLFDGDIEFNQEQPTPESIIIYGSYDDLKDFENGKTYTVTINNERQDIVCENDELIFVSSELNMTFRLTEWDVYIENSESFESSYHIKIETAETSTTLKQLDEKFIPDTIARVEDIPEINYPVTSVNGQIGNIQINIPEQVQADWNQNDEAAVDFIKNRTHYENIVETSVILADEEVYLELLPDIPPSGVWSEPITLKNGKTYTVIVNDVDYGTVYEQELVCENDELIFDSEELQNTLTIQSAAIYGVNEGTYHIKIETTEVSGTLKQLDEKFIPDTIARVENIPTTAIKPFPYYEVNELSPGFLTQYKVNLEELEVDTLYSAQESASTTYLMFALCIICDDGTEKIVTNVDSKTFAYRVIKTTKRITVHDVFNNSTTTIDISDKSTSSNIVVTSNVISKWLPVTNSVEYTPTDNYHPATKKYVDDSVAVAVPQPAIATVGQTIIVKSVDENGKPTEWEAVDPWIINSSTEGSTKKFKVTIDDTGTLTASEIIISEEEDELPG